jgi:hypothetical protein
MADMLHSASSLVCSYSQFKLDRTRILSLYCTEENTWLGAERETARRSNLGVGCES